MRTETTRAGAASGGSVATVSDAAMQQVVEATDAEDALTAALSELVANTRTLDANVDLNDYLYEDIDEDIDEDEFEDSATLETQVVDIVSEIVALNEEYDFRCPVLDADMRERIRGQALAAEKAQ